MPSVCMCASLHRFVGIVMFPPRRSASSARVLGTSGLVAVIVSLVIASVAIGVRAAAAQEAGSGGGSWTQTAMIFTPYSAPNRLPVAQDDTASVVAGEAVEIDVLANDRDPERGGLVVVGVSDPTHGSVIHGRTVVTYTADRGFHGRDTFTYQVNDRRGASATADVTVEVEEGAGNRRPVARDDTATVAAGEWVTVDVLANDTDPDGDELTLVEATGVPSGRVDFGPSGITYRPSDGFTGRESIPYVVGDGHGSRDRATLRVIVEEVGPAEMPDAGRPCPGDASRCDPVGRDTGPVPDIGLVWGGDDRPAERGCSCRQTGGGPIGVGWFALVILAGVVGRRTRQ